MSPVAAIARALLLTDDAYAGGSDRGRAGDVHVPSVLSQYTGVLGVVSVPAMSVTFSADSVTTPSARPLVKVIPTGSGRRAPASGHAAPVRVHTAAIGWPKLVPIPPTAVSPSSLIARACCQPRSLSEPFPPLTTYAMSGLGTTERDYAASCPGTKLGEGLAVRGEEVAEAEPAVAAWLRRISLLA